MIDRMVGVGVPLKVAKKAVKKFMKEKDDPRRMLNNALIKMAESLDLPCATIHTPADNHNLWALRFTLEKIGQKQLVKQSPCMTNCAPKISNCHIADLQEIESGYIKIDFLRPFNVVSHFVLYSRIYVRIFSVDSKPFCL